ncbi:MAG: NADH-ubiquinone oxidoreductase-F iron-sulfur binding region domain-containing protein [Planctomycetota bacterium]
MADFDALQEIGAQRAAVEQAVARSIDVCTSAGCQISREQGGTSLVAAFNREVTRQGLQDKCRVRGVGCLGPCAAGPCVTLRPTGTLYGHVHTGDVEALVETMTRQPVTRLSIPTDTPFFQRQTKVVLENSGRIDPTRLDDYLAVGGYQPLAHTLRNLQPADVVREVTTSGLRGRGGAGYPTGRKWQAVAHSPGTHKYVVCNADEGDPGAFMDRAILESDPLRVIEGITIAAYAVGAEFGYIYVRAEYPLAITRLKLSLRHAVQQGLLGSRIGGTDFSFSIELRMGGGAFVCGEETALLASIEGRRGTPRPRPPYPAEQGLFGCPTLINNVETFANVPSIMRHGGDWFAQLGTKGSTGTKVFALAGQVSRGGLIEVPMGISLREIIFDMGGGPPAGRLFKAVQTGGPSGGCIPTDYLDLPIDYESLASVGSIMGSGGMIVIDDQQNMVEVARYFMNFCQCESCGKCIPCRMGTHLMTQLLDRFCQHQATARDLEQLRELCGMVKRTSLCGLGQSAPNPVLSTMRFFEHEYRDCLANSTASAGVGEPF